LYGLTSLEVRKDTSFHERQTSDTSKNETVKFVRSLSLEKVELKFDCSPKKLNKVLLSPQNQNEEDFEGSLKRQIFF